MSIEGLSFHWYGVFIALAVVLVYAGARMLLKRENHDVEWIDTHFLWIVLAGVVGARIWHSVTDFYLYTDSLLSIFAVWNGGMSIFGAIAGVMSYLLVMMLNSERFRKQDMLLVFDAAAFFAPLGQALGRMGNVVNQELYGGPTTLPWKWFIEPSSRLPEFAEVAYYHPLPIYEALLLLIVFIVFCVMYWKGRWRIGSGTFLYAYLLGYFLLRIALDTLRLQKTGLDTSLGFVGYNQVLLVVLSGVLIVARKKILR